MSSSGTKTGEPGTATAPAVKASVLVVEDEEMIQELFRATLKRAGYRVDTAGTLAELREIISTRSYDVVLLDLQLPDGRSDEVIEELLQRDPATQIIIVTGDYSVETATAVTRMGAFDYLLKPMRTDRLLQAVAEARGAWLRHSEKEARSRETMARVRSRNRLVGTSAETCRANLLIQQASKADDPVLISGEEGTGKDLVATAIHELSPRRERPFVRINTKTIPRPLLEAEVFGEVENDVLVRKGLLEMAEGGTVYLDEIAGFPMEMQEQFATLIREGVFCRGGSETPRTVNVRIIASTSKNISALMDGGDLLPTFVSALKGIHVILCPLREHIEDVEELAEHFLRVKSLELGKSVSGFAPEVLEFFHGYDWPGNVRELGNMVERLLLLAREEVTMVDRDLFGKFCLLQYQGDGNSGESTANVGRKGVVPFRQIEETYLRKLLRKTQFNLDRACAASGLTNRDLLQKIEHNCLGEWLEEHRG